MWIKPEGKSAYGCTSVLPLTPDAPPVTPTGEHVLPLQTACSSEQRLGEDEKLVAHSSRWFGDQCPSCVWKIDRCSRRAH